MSPTYAARPRAVLVTLAVLLTGLVGTSPAYAHARLVSTSPADGATVPRTPSVVVLTFSEDLLPATVHVEVHDGEGVPVADGAPRVAGATVTQPLVAGLSAGGYQVAYRVVSKDGHPVSGTTTFRALRAADPTPTSPPPSPGASTSSAPATTSPAPTSSTPPPSATAAATPGGASGEGGSPLPTVGLGLVVLLVGALAYALLRRRAPLR